MSETDDYPPQWNAELKPSDWFFYVKIPLLRDIPYSVDQTFSIIIPNWRHTAFLPTVVRNITSQQYPLKNYEIIIVDDNSDAPAYIFGREYDIFEVMDIIKQLWWEMDISFYETHQNVTYNICKAANIGFKRAKYDNIIINPADAWQSGNYLQRASSYMEFFKDKAPDKRFAICGNILSDSDLENRWITDVGLVAKKDDLHKITGYNEKMRGWGSNEGNLTGRLGLSGVREGHTDSLTIMHGISKKCQALIGIPWPGNPSRLTQMGPGENNGTLDNEDYSTQTYAPNDDSWGELDTLEKVF